MLVLWKTNLLPIELVHVSANSAVFQILLAEKETLYVGVYPSSLGFSFPKELKERDGQTGCTL